MTFDLHRYLIYFPLEYQLDIEQMARDSHHMMRGEWGTIEDPT
jgi:hypothetical protein